VRRPGDGRVALAGAGRALMGLRGFPEARARNVAPYWFGAPGKPFRRRSGIPFRTADQEPSLPTTPLSTSRAPSGHEPEGRRRSDQIGPTPPSPASSPFSACSAADSVNAGLPGPPPSVLSVSHALDGLHSAAPSGLVSSRWRSWGSGLQGLVPRRGAETSLEAPCSLAVQIRSSRVAKRRTDPRSSELSSPRRVRVVGGRNPSHGRCPPDLFPSKALSTSAVGQDRSFALPCERSGELRAPPPMHFTRRRVLRSLPRTEAKAFPPRGGAGLSGVFHLVASRPSKASSRFGGPVQILNISNTRFL
jgi:hypothetical protein